jgi:hypothetical protein
MPKQPKVYTSEDILKLVVSFKKDLQQINNGVFSKKNKEEKLPEFYPNYKFQVELMDAIRVHAERGYFPDTLFKERSPNETDVEFKYRKNNYKQITLPIFIDFVNTVSRSMHDANWSIEYSEDNERFKEEFSFQKYVETDILKFGSVEEFIKNFLITYKIIDANGVVVVKPDEIDIIETEDGQRLINDTTLIEPQPFYYSSKQILAYEEGEFALIDTGEKSNVMYGNGKQKNGFIFEFYDTITIWRVVQVGKYNDFQFDITEYFNHNWQILPARKLKGVPFLRENKVIYQSPFTFAVDNLDIALLNNSNLQIATGKCAFPTPVMYGSVCDFEDDHHNRCMDGKLNVEGEWKTCPSCQGTGLRSRMNPMGTILLKPPTREDEGDRDMKQQPLSYVSPSSEILKFLEESIEKNEVKARKILHLRDSDSSVTFSDDTATTSNNDLKSTYAFIKPISDQIFSLYEFILNAIGWMRYGEFFQSPTLHFPITFDFKTENDYLVEINNAVKVGLPPFALHTILFKYLNTIFFTEKQPAQALNLIVESDRLFGMTKEDITFKLAKGLIANWEDILHHSAITLIKDLVREDESFFEKEIEVQVEALKNKAKEVAAELAPLSPAASITTSILGE